MSNYLTLQLASNMLIDQGQTYSKHMLESAHNRENTQIISDYAGLAALAFNNFIGNLGNPLTSQLFFSNIPIADYWNTYQKSVVADLHILYHQYHILGTTAQVDAEIEDVKNRMTVSAVNSLYNQIKAMQPTGSKNSGTMTWYVFDNFMDTTKVDLNATTALITSHNVELARVDSSNFNAEIQIAVDDQYVYEALNLDKKANQNLIPLSTGISNGFVGNIHEVKVTENTNTSTVKTNAAVPIKTENPSKTIAFVGDSDLHNDISVVLDGSGNTWFEYEVCNIPSSLKHNPCLEYGFDLTLGNTKSTNIQIPWYEFHTSALALGSVPTVADKEMFPEPPNTYSDSPYSQDIDLLSGNYLLGGGVSANPLTGTKTSIPYASGSSMIAFEEGGAKKTGDILRLGIIAQMSADQMMSQINITPHVIHNKVPTIVSVEVKGSQDTQWTVAKKLKKQNDDQALGKINDTISPKANAGDIEVWYFHLQEINQFRILVEQRESYNTNIGHIVWATPTISMGIADHNHISTSIAALPIASGLPKHIQRVNGPEISIENLVKAKPTRKHKHDKIGAVLSLIPGIDSFLLNSHNAHKPYGIQGPFLESFPGWRYAIGISNIDFNQYTYAQNSLLQSINQTVPIDIKTVRLEVSEDIPIQFPKDTDWITYQFSIDHGNSWYPIAPSTDLHSDSPKIYYVNPQSGHKSVPHDAKVIDTVNYTPTKPITNIVMAAVLNSPDFQSTLSPHLNMYKLILTGDTL